MKNVTKHLAYGITIQLAFLAVLSLVDIHHKTSIPVMGYLKLVFYVFACIDFIAIPILGLLAIGVTISDKKDTTNFAAMTAGLFLGMIAYFVIIFLFKTMIP